MSAWPVIKTAHDLCAEGIVPCSEDTLRALAKRHQIGRKLGRAYVFTPADIQALVEKLPCPSSSSSDMEAKSGTSVALSEDFALTKALEFATAPRRNKSSSSGRRNSSTSPSTVTPFPARSRKRP